MVIGPDCIAESVGKRDDTERLVDARSEVLGHRASMLDRIQQPIVPIQIYGHLSQGPGHEREAMG